MAGSKVARPTTAHSRLYARRWSALSAVLLTQTGDLFARWLEEASALDTIDVYNSLGMGTTVIATN